MEAFLPAIPQLLPSLGSTPEDAHRAAVGITTTGEAVVMCAVACVCALLMRCEPALQAAPRCLCINCQATPCLAAHIKSNW